MEKREVMKNNINRLLETKIAFCSGFTPVFGYASYLMKIDVSQIAVDAAFKIIIAALVGIVGGMAGLLGKDIYNKCIKKYIVKK